VRTPGLTLTAMSVRGLVAWHTVMNNCAKFITIRDVARMVL
jgi:hypothetical protein